MLLNGVRSAAIASRQAARGQGEDRKGEGERTMAVSLRESVAQVSDPGNLDASVEEVFQMMMGVECRRSTAQMPVNHDESVTAVVGFGGLLSGACIFKSGSETALSVAAHMTGIEFAEVDDTVKDAIGEVCNMLAGSWKGKVPELSANCGLSVPAVITGRDYNLHVQSPEFQLHHVYTFGDNTFSVTILCDGLQ
ncbi:MAG: chemotaxis protein CheX [Terracidiphilus sp.]|jgi:chemotaxis protein CheX